MISKLQQKISGFTLVEMLVYVAIFMIVSVSSVTFLLSLDEFVAQYKVETALYRSGTNAMEQIILSLREADTYNSAGSILHDGTIGTLSVTADTTTTIFTKNGGDLNLSIAGVEYGNLVSDTVTVNDFTVYEYDTTKGQFVRVKLSLTATVEGNTKSITLYGGSVIRGAL